MNIIKKFFLIIKNIFKKQEIKTLEEPKLKAKQNSENKFIESIKIKKNSNKNIKIPICEGDGLGIQRKLNY